MVRLFFFWSPISFSVYMPSRPNSRGSLPHVSMYVVALRRVCARGFTFQRTTGPCFNMFTRQGLTELPGEPPGKIQSEDGMIGEGPTRFALSPCRRSYMCGEYCTCSMRVACSAEARSKSRVPVSASRVGLCVLFERRNWGPGGHHVDSTCRGKRGRSSMGTLPSR